MKADWRPVASQAMLERRAAMYAVVRRFMRDRSILEVETPVLSTSANPDDSIQPVTVNSPTADGTREPVYLQTSPEFPMKRMLAGGCGPVYQICRVFRAGETGRLHRPEFSMLEWYRPGMNERGLMDEVADLLEALGLDRAARFSYAEYFQHDTGLDPHTCATNRLQALARERGLLTERLDRGALLDFLFSDMTRRKRSTEACFFIHDYPACQAALARIKDDDPPLAARFELFINGMEIANGFHELNDSDEQRRRFQDDNERRKQHGLPEVRLDERLLAALDGLPDCAGVALGLDRLLMCITGADDIREVLTFPDAAG